MRVQVAVGSLEDKGVKSVKQINHVCLWVKRSKDVVWWFTQLLNASRGARKKERENGSLKCQPGHSSFYSTPTPFGTVDEPFFPRFLWSSLKEAKWDFHVGFEAKSKG